MDEGPLKDCSRLSLIIIKLTGGKNPDEQGLGGGGGNWKGFRLKRRKMGKEGTGNDFQKVERKGEFFSITQYFAIAQDTGATRTREGGLG